MAGAAEGAAGGARRRAERARAAPSAGRRTAGIPRFDPAARAVRGRPDGEDHRAVRARRGGGGRALRRAARCPPLTAAHAGVDVLEREDLPAPVLAATARPSRGCSSEAPKPLAKSARARSEEQPELALDGDAPEAWRTPPLSLLQSPSTIVRHHLSTTRWRRTRGCSRTCSTTTGCAARSCRSGPGPVVTMYELEPAAGLKASRVIGLADDIARSMSALACRVSTIPGRSVIGIELPNELRERVLLREILSAKAYGDSAHALPLALGKDIGGEPVVANLARMPHLLIAGTTGSGKSVAINTMILSLLYKLAPDECRLIMIDPKMLELQRLRRHPAPARRRWSPTRRRRWWR